MTTRLDPTSGEQSDRTAGGEPLSSAARPSANLSASWEFAVPNRSPREHDRPRARLTHCRASVGSSRARWRAGATATGGTATLASSKGFPGYKTCHLPEDDDQPAIHLSGLQPSVVTDERPNRMRRSTMGSHVFGRLADRTAELLLENASGRRYLTETPKRETRSSRVR
jgi:hypothetical protein